MQNAMADMMMKGKSRVKTVFNFYHQNSNDGKQVIDNSGVEETNVLEPMIFVEHQITEDTAINGRFVFDAWTAASDTKLDANTGASSGEARKSQTRIAANVGARQEKGKWSYGLNLGMSSEYDYSSLNAAVDIARSFAMDNFTLGLGIQYYSDKLSLFENLNDSSISEDKPRKILAVNMAASQILTRKDIIQFDVTFARSTDTLESTANTVLVGGSRQVEQLPDSRSRYGISTKWVHGLGSDSAINLSYRYYFDQWDLSSHTLRAAWLHELNETDDFLELFVRAYDQKKVEYYADSFDASREFMTSDSDMDDFQSYEAGIYHLNNLEDRKILGLDLSNVTWSNGFTYYTRTNGMRYAYIQTALGFEFQ